VRVVFSIEAPNEGRPEPADSCGYGLLEAIPVAHRRIPAAQWEAFKLLPRRFEFQYRLTNVSGFPFGAFATDDLSAPAAHWTFVGVGIESSPGQYQFTDPQAPSHPRRFYVVKSP
jgi:hypothetical protein